MERRHDVSKTCSGSGHRRLKIVVLLKRVHGDVAQAAQEEAHLSPDSRSPSPGSDRSEVRQREDLFRLNVGVERDSESDGGETARQCPQ